MKGWELIVCLLPFVISGASFGDELTEAGRRVVRRAGSVTISTMEFRGWENAYHMTNGDVELVVVPQIARIMKYSLADGENQLWINDELTPETTGEQYPEPGRYRWANFGGYKMWLAPEKQYGSPPDWQLDRGPCEVSITADGALQLTGMPSDKYGIRFDRKIILAPRGTRVEIEQTMHNVSDKPLTGAIWDVTQLKSDCVALIPLDPGSKCRIRAGTAPDEQWSEVGDTLLLRPSGKVDKAFISGPPGWLACVRGDLLYLKVFEIADTPPPKPETPREVFTCNNGYIELEIVGATATLEPGQQVGLNETWHLVPLEQPASDRALTEAVRQAADGRQ